MSLYVLVLGKDVGSYTPIAEDKDFPWALRYRKCPRYFEGLPKVHFYVGRSLEINYKPELHETRLDM